LILLTSIVGCGDDGDDPAPTDSGDVAADVPTPEDGADVVVADGDQPPDVVQGDIECAPKFSKTCQDAGTVVWLASCGNEGVIYELCGKEKVCQFGQCNEICYTNDKKECHNNNVFWFDSCGNSEGVAEMCQEGQWCVDAACVDADYSGTWTVTADPDKQHGGLLGQVMYAGGDAQLEIADGQVTLTFPDRSYTGALTENAFVLTAKYTEEGPPVLSHVSELTAEFATGEQFFGVEKDTVSSEGSPTGPALVWNLTGAKKL